MKRATQILAVLMVLVLGTGPAWAALSCAGDSEMDSACPMDMRSMGADCPMTHSLAAANCVQDCCEQRAQTAEFVSAVMAKPSPVKALLQAQVQTLSPVVLPASHPVNDAGSAENSPPRYILLHVFRI